MCAVRLHSFFNPELVNVVGVQGAILLWKSERMHTAERLR
jgi:hypothetical protein